MLEIRGKLLGDSKPWKLGIVLKESEVKKSISWRTWAAITLIGIESRSAVKELNNC